MEEKGLRLIVQGLQYGVPQLIVPGKVFERKYNAKSVSDLGAATAKDIKDYVFDLIQRGEMNKAMIIGGISSMFLVPNKKKCPDDFSKIIEEIGRWRK